jgi:hypothetical protein
VSLSDFQRALSDMTLDARLAARVRKHGTAALDDYHLTPLEQRRLSEIARQPGMDLNCTLARGNRLAPIVEMFPLTCELLKPSLRELLDEFWQGRRPDNYQLVGEDEAFAEFLSRKIERAELDQQPYAEEVLRYERTCVALAKSLRFTSAEDLPAHGDARVRFVRFEHDPRVLVRELENRTLPPPDVPKGDYLVRITLSGDALEVELDESN